MAYEKLSVVYQYRDDPDCEGSDEEDSTNPDWWKSENLLQKEAQKEAQNKNKKGLISSNTEKHDYNKVAVNGSPEKPASSGKDTLISDGGEGPPERRSVSERLKGALSNASHGIGNWLLTSTRESVPVDTFLCGGNAGLTSANLHRTTHPSSRVSEPRNY